MLATTCSACNERYYSASPSAVKRCPRCGEKLTQQPRCLFVRTSREKLYSAAWNRYLQQPIPAVGESDCLEHSTSRVLVIDDDSDIREGLKLLLEGEGYRVALASNGKEAIASVTRDLPDLVLLDMMMPVMDGWQFSAALRESGLANAMPVFVMTGVSQNRDIRAEVGAAGLLQKPFDVPDLLAQVAQVVR